MTRRTATTAATLATAAALIAPSAAALAGPTAHAGTTAHAARAATVRLGRTSAGKLLETSSGFTLYQFTADRHDHDSCVSKPGCASAWPPYTVHGRPVAGAGVKASLLGTITISGGRHQVTYAGHPLYRYVEDSGPGATDYLGFSSFGGSWDGLTASGARVS
jgi:predicted lipoprotein with Yx(FWY)xxD motif